MAYDITIFTTIASASASFVAILGGFIASKLIAINGEREHLISCINETNTKLEMNEEERNRLQKGLDEDDALDFIKENIDALINGESLDKVYEEDKQNFLTFDLLLPFWKKGLEMVERFDKALDTDETLSEDDIPCSLAISVKDDPFEYSVCEEIAKVNLPRFVRPLIPSGNWYERDKQRVYNLDFEIAALIIQKNEYLKQKTL